MAGDELTRSENIGGSVSASSHHVPAPRIQPPRGKHPVPSEDRSRSQRGDMERETNQSLSTGVGLKHRGGRGIYILLFYFFTFFLERASRRPMWRVRERAGLQITYHRHTASDSIGLQAVNSMLCTQSPRYTAQSQHRYGTVTAQPVTHRAHGTRRV